MVIKYKAKVSVFNNGFYLKNLFVVTININHTVILPTPFIDMITPSETCHKSNGLKLVFSFLENSKTRSLNLIKACSIHTHHINGLIQEKEVYLMHLKQ